MGRESSVRRVFARERNIREGIIEVAGALEMLKPERAFASVTVEGGYL